MTFYMLRIKVGRNHIDLYQLGFPTKRPSCSPATRQAAWRRTSPSCRSCCVEQHGKGRGQ
jgi:hypothetical protein